MGDGSDDGTVADGGDAGDGEELEFEEAIDRLEEIVDDLEGGRAADADLDLDRALALYEEGVGLVRACRDRLEDAEQRLETLDVDGAGGDEGDGGSGDGDDADDGAASEDPDGDDDPGAGPNETLGGPE